MYLIKLNATESTNAYLKQYILSSEQVEDYTVVVANEQLEGRGQMGTTWDSEVGKNLTFSVLKKIEGFPVSNQFVLNMCISLAIYDFLKQQQVPDLSVKWPNDILSGHSKTCGVLIENILSGNKIQASVIGIGLNVNQMEFKGLSNVSSLKLLMGQNFNLDALLHSFIIVLKKYFSTEIQKPNEDLRKAYEKVLFRKDKPSTFRSKDGELFMGFIRGVSPEGKLLVAVEDNIILEFGLKEVQLLY